MAKPIQVVEYDASWPTLFDLLSDFVTPALADIAIAIEHVGSTAVPGLAAKPIIYIDVVVSSQNDITMAVQRLESLGYIHEGDLGIAGRDALTPPIGLPPHHLYVCAANNAELRRHILFRDYLKSHPEEAQIYAELKMKLAYLFPDDRDAYTNGNSAFVDQRLRQVGWEDG